MAKRRKRIALGSGTPYAGSGGGGTSIPNMVTSEEEKMYLQKTGMAERRLKWDSRIKSSLARERQKRAIVRGGEALIKAALKKIKKAGMSYIKGNTYK